VAQTTPHNAEYAGTKIYDFPVGRILVWASPQAEAENHLRTGLPPSPAAQPALVALGTAAASATSLTSTMVDLLPPPPTTSSTTINVAGAAVGVIGGLSAHFDGTTTAKDVYLNTAIATGSADGTQTISGTVEIVWIQLGDY